MRVQRCLQVLGLAALLGAGCGGASRQHASRGGSLPPDTTSGVALYHAGRFAQAEAALLRFTSEHPGEPEGWAYLGLSRVKLGMVEEGETALRRALELDGENAEAHFGFGLVRARAGELDEAIAELKHAVRSNPSHAYAHYYLGLAYNEKGAKDSAMVHLQRFVDLAPDAPEAPRIRSLLSGVS